MKTVLVTGATGFLGRNIVEKLTQKSMKVIATGRTSVLRDYFSSLGVNYIPENLECSTHSQSLYDSTDGVIHCAGLSGDWGNYQQYYQANVVATERVIDHCLKHGITKLVFISSPSIYFNGKSRLNVSEDEVNSDPLSSHYAQTKYLAEQAVKTARKRGLNSICFRPKALYGPYENTFIPRILSMAEQGRVPLINNGSALADITYVDNFIDALWSALHADDSAWNQSYNISNGEPITIKQWFELILQDCGYSYEFKNIPSSLASVAAMLMETWARLSHSSTPPRLTRHAVGYLSNSLTLDNTKANKLLGYKPRINNELGFSRYRDWFATIK